MEWDLNDRWENEVEFSKEFSALGDRYSAEFNVHFMNRIQTVGLFVSKQSHVLMEMLNKYETDYFPNIGVSFIIGSDEALRIIADRYGVPFFCIPVDGDRSSHEDKQLEIINRYKPDCIGLANYSKPLSKNLIGSIECPVINIHNAFLPPLPGSNPYKLAYDSGAKLIGATSSFVGSGSDHGPIIEQGARRVVPGASMQDMMKVGQSIEQQVFVHAMLKVLEHKTIIHKNKTIIFN